MNRPPDLQRGDIDPGGRPLHALSGGRDPDRISGSSGRDQVTADRIDRVARNCERVRRR